MGVCHTLHGDDVDHYIASMNWNTLKMKGAGTRVHHALHGEKSSSAPGVHELGSDRKRQTDRL